MMAHRLYLRCGPVVHGRFISTFPPCQHQRDESVDSLVLAIHPHKCRRGVYVHV